MKYFCYNLPQMKQMSVQKNELLVDLQQRFNQALTDLRAEKKAVMERYDAKKIQITKQSISTSSVDKKISKN
ncbi:MAG: hypothetical protein ACD_43C00019G0003 [uncultured bacterium]|nr:MAG: hypothetical protein ACD_43C00019G0003 [uncultured bacterium]